MTGLVFLLLYGVGVALGAAVLTPVFYYSARWVVDLSPLFAELKHIPITRYFDRAALVSAVILLWPLLRAMGTRHMIDLGIKANPNWRIDLKWGVAIGVFGVAAVACVLLGFDILAFHGIALRSILLALGTGITVALIEEFYFRGVILGTLRRYQPESIAIAVSAVLFAVVHLAKPHRVVPHGINIDWAVGFKMLPYTAGWITDIGKMWDAMPLLVLGCIVGFATCRTGSLVFAMGFHGGLVFALRLLKKSSERILDPDFFVGKRLNSGLLPTLLLLVCAALIWYVLNRRRMGCDGIKK